MCVGKAPSIELWLSNQVTVLASPSVPLKTIPQIKESGYLPLHVFMDVCTYVYMCVVSTAYVCGACVSARHPLCTLGVAHSLTHRCTWCCSLTHSQVYVVLFTHSLTHRCTWCCSLTHSLTGVRGVAHSLTHSLTHSLAGVRGVARSLTHSLIRTCM